ncbi:MAG TPA: SGNH/GDSL hydrolase family protein [Steroidobacteraceae bacterium]|nr:SGNH/GDSL hydrolase family protein [Steroidobacteraceae bacterium]
MRILGRVLTVAALAGLTLQAVAATPRTAADNWIGVWGYVIAPPAPGPAVAAFVLPAPAVTPLGAPPAPAAAPAPRAFPPPLLENPGNVPVDVTTAEVRNTTVRQLVRVSAAGSRLRLRFSNEDSPDALTLGSVHVGLAGADGSIVAGTDHAVTFDGQSGIVIPASSPALSDAIDLPTKALDRLYISVHVPGPMTLRAARTLFQYVAGTAGDFTGAPALPGVRLMRVPVLVTLVESQPTAPTNVVVTLGDSITEGAASTANAFRGWPDRLAERLADHHWAVVNTGISGNRLLRYGAGPSALARLDRDVLSVPGIKAIILLEGINDIGRGFGTPNSTEPVTAEALEAADKQIIARAHEHGIRVIGATLTPYQGASYASPAGEAAREALNTWIKSSGSFDAVIDFAPAVADPTNPLTFAKAFNDRDHLHPNDAGYKAMGDVVDLAVLGK